MNNNDPFKKMDLNFDPTVEVRIDPKPQGSEGQTSQPQQTVPQPQQPIVREEVKQPEIQFPEFASSAPSSVEREMVNEPVLQNNETIEHPMPQFEKLNDFNTTTLIEGDKTNEFILEGTLTSNDSHKPVQKEEMSMDKTLEFIIQNQPIDTDLTVDAKKQAKLEEKKAYAHRRKSYIWVVICLLTILYGIGAIFTFGQHLADVIDAFKTNDAWALDLTLTILYSIEAFLFIFWIGFAMIKYNQNHKPWMKWWDDTEPLRITKWIKEEKELNVKYLQRINALGLYYTHVNKESTSDHQTLSHLREENKILSDMINKEEKRRAEAAKANKKK